MVGLAVVVVAAVVVVVAGGAVTGCNCRRRGRSSWSNCCVVKVCFRESETFIISYKAEDFQRNYIVTDSQVSFMFNSRAQRRLTSMEFESEEVSERASRLCVTSICRKYKN